MIDKILVLKFQFKPWELMALTVPECFGLYLNALEDQHKAEHPNDNDERLAPHLIDEQKAEQERLFEHARAYHKLTPEQKIEIARRAY